MRQKEFHSEPRSATIAVGEWMYFSNYKHRERSAVRRSASAHDDFETFLKRSHHQFGCNEYRVLGSIGLCLKFARIFRLSRFDHLPIPLLNLRNK